MLATLKREKGFYKSLITFSIPIILQNLLSASVGFVDAFMLGILGQNELAAISLAQTPFFVAMLMIFGLQSGSSILISQYWGKGDIKTVSRVLGISWTIALITTTGLATVMFALPHEVMRLFTNNEILIDIAARYSKIMAYSMVMNSFTIVYIGARRSCGAPKFGTVVMTISAFVNVLLNYMLIFGNFGAPALGVEGAAIGTMITRALEVTITIGFIIFADRKVKTMALYIKNILVPGVTIFKDFIKYSAPVVINETLWAVGVSLCVVIYGHMTASGDIMAAYSLAGNIERILMLVVFSVANAAAVFTGKIIGSGKSNDEIFSLGKTFFTLSVIVGFICGIMLLGVTYGIIKPFIFPLLDLTINAQLICIYLLVLRSIFTPIRSGNTTLMVGVLRAGGDVNTILIIDMIGLYAWALPLAALTAFVFHQSIFIVYFIIISEEALKFVICIFRFKSRKWIKNVTREMA